MGWKELRIIQRITDLNKSCVVSTSIIVIMAFFLLAFNSRVQLVNVQHVVKISVKHRLLLKISHSLEYITAVLTHNTLINFLVYKMFSYAYNLHHPILASPKLVYVQMPCDLHINSHFPWDTSNVMQIYHPSGKTEAVVLFHSIDNCHSG